MKEKIRNILMSSLIIAFLTATVISACSSPMTEQTQPVTQKPRGPEKGHAEILVDYRIINANTRTWVEKIGVDGHEYLMFGDGLANPPTVLHNEACPCKQTTK